MKRVFFAGITVIAALFCSNAHGFTVSYEQATTGIQKGVIQTTFVKIKDEKMRMEVDTPQGRNIAIIDGPVAYQYIPSEKRAYKVMTKGPTNIKNLSDYRGYLQTLNAKIIGSESVGNYDCDIYEFTDPGANVRAKAWVWRAKNFPVKYELDLPSGLVTTIMKDVKINEGVADSEFVIPPDVEIMDMRPTTGQGNR